MLTLATRNESGLVSIETEDGQVSATIPKTRSMIGMLATNGLVNGGEYKEDGFIYMNGVPVRKWHGRFDGHRLWEPKLKDLASLYRLHKKAANKNDAQWAKVRGVLDELTKTCDVNDKIIAHALPTHHHSGNANDWWEYQVHKSAEGVSFSFQWTSGKPKKLRNEALGQRLYEYERRWWDTTCKRVGLTRTIFYAALRQSLPTASENKIQTLQFEDDNYCFYTEMNNYGQWSWKMFDGPYKIEFRRIV